MNKEKNENNNNLNNNNNNNNNSTNNSINEEEYYLNNILNNNNNNNSEISDNNNISSSYYNYNNEYNEFNDFSFEAVDFDTKFRSMQTLNDTNNNNLFHSSLSSSSTSAAAYLSEGNYSSYDTVNIPHLNKDNKNIPLQDNYILQQQQQQNKQSQQLNIIIDSSSINVPEKPFYLGPSQFLCALTLTDLIFRMQQKLDSIFEVSYNFCQNSCRWEGVYLRGSSRCKFELNLYKDSPTSFLIEGNRLSGDSVPFRNIFNELKSTLMTNASFINGNNNNNNNNLSGNSRTNVSSGIPTLSSPQPLPCNDVLQPDEAKEALQSILSMANSSHLESKIEAVKILCDLSYQSDMHYLLCDNNCIEILIEFMKIEHEYCNQFAVCALANLSSSRTCQSIMMKLCSSFVPLLLTSVIDGPYENAEMRRECARTFANLCISHSSKIVNIVGTSNTSEWLNTIEELKDERLKLHAERAKNHLMACF